MRLSDLDNSALSPTVVLLQTPSSRLQLFLEDKIKRMKHITQDSSITVETKKDLKKVREVLGVSPPFSDMWYVTVNLDDLNCKELHKEVLDSTTCIFFCTCSKYSTFKNFKDAISKKEGVFDYYITYLKRVDLVYLYDGFVRSDNKLSKVLFDYVAQGYSGDIESIMELLVRLSKGEVFETRKDIAEVCGIGGLSVESYIFSLVKPLSGSDKGLKKVLKNRVQAGAELGESLGFSSFYNFLSRSLYLLAQLKELMIAGVVYKSVRNLPDNYDEKALARYQKYIWRLKDIPLSRILRIKSCMGDNVWKNELDFLGFIYKYYELEGLNCLK